MRKSIAIIMIVICFILSSCSKETEEKSVPFEAVMKTYQNISYFEDDDNNILFELRLFSTNKYEKIDNVQLFNENEIEVSIIDTSISTNDKTGYFLDRDIDEVYEYFIGITIAKEEAEITKMKLSLDGEGKEFEIGLVKVTKLPEEYKFKNNILLQNMTASNDYNTVYKEDDVFFTFKSNSNDSITIKSVEIFNEVLESYTILIDDQPFDQYDKEINFEDVVKVRIQLKYSKYIQEMRSYITISYEINGLTYYQYIGVVQSSQSMELSKYDFER